MSNTKEKDSQFIMSTYGRYNFTVDKAKGSYLYNEDSKECIDFGSGIGTLCLGSCDDGYIKAVTDQLCKTQHTSNYFTCKPVVDLAEKIVLLSGLSKVFFANSGAEANEGAIKLARKYSNDKYGQNRQTIITFQSSFHGRTITTLAATGQDVFHQHFFPFTEGFKYCEPNNLDAFSQSLTDDVCAIMFECIQGEGGVNVMNSDFIKTVYDECKKRDILVIIDEIQTGIGRTGKMFAFQHYDIKPDVITLAKGLGGGLPIGAVVAAENCCNVLTKGLHGSTFGGNPVSCAAGNYVLDVISGDGFLDDVTKKGLYIKERLLSLGKDTILEVKGKGLMIGIKTSLPLYEVASKALEKGLFVLTAGKDVIRLLPPLNITYEQIDKGLDILSELL